MSERITEERNEAFDSAMREKISDYEPTVPHALWNRISAELNETEEVATPSIPHYAEAATTPRWKIAIAAAIVLTIGAGSLLFTFNPKNEISSTPTAHNTVSATAPAAVVPVSENKTVAQSAPAVVKQSVAVKAENVTNEPAVNTTASTITPETTTAAQNNEENQLASMPPASQNNPVETGIIPVSALKILSSPVSLNDEITVIQSTPSKKKNRKHATVEETTKVIMLGKKYDSAPDIRYQVPVRF
jgi:hypothetical protein